MAESDLPLVRRWLLEPHVRRWWDEKASPTYPDEELADRLSAVRGEDPTDHVVVELEGRPIGDIQSYLIDDHDEYRAQIGLEETAFGVDLYIGEPDLIGRGIGPAMLGAFLRDVAFPRYGLDLCIIDPTRSNAYAIRAYEKVGFRFARSVLEPGTREPEHHLMELRRSTWTEP
jgi:RimJ/RimL family protein N-acetyltransferase